MIIKDKKKYLRMAAGKMAAENVEFITEETIDKALKDISAQYAIPFVKESIKDEYFIDQFYNMSNRDCFEFENFYFNLRGRELEIETSWDGTYEGGDIRIYIDAEQLYKFLHYRLGKDIKKWTNKN